MKNGRYGAYVTAGGVNATIPSDKTPDTITLAEAIALIDERAAKGGGKPKRGAKKAKRGEEGCARPTRMPRAKPAKKAAAKKAAAKPKSEAVSKARAPVDAGRQDIAGQAGRAAKAPAKKSAGKARG